MPYIGLSDIIYQEFAKLKRTLEVQPINLGGIIGSGGGVDGRPGGFLGRLPQTRITYDKSEYAASGLSTSPTLVDNLNHIRYRLNTLEGRAVDIKASGVLLGGATVLDFSGEFDVSILPSGEANVGIRELDNIRHATFDILPSGLPNVPGQVSWNANEYTLDVITGLGPILQMGQEIYILIYNDTGTTINNLTVLRPKGATVYSGQVVPTVERARADVYSKCEGTIMVATMDIPNNSIGLATRFGKARGGNTFGYTPGAGIYLSPTVSGAFTETRPSFPNFDISLGGIIKADATDGEIVVSVTRDIFDTTKNFWNGVFRESIDFLITSNGTTVTGTLTPTNGHDDMTMIFSDGFSLLDTSPGATVTLTPGTDTNPQIQYVYVPQSTKTLTVSTSDWPTGEHIKVATVVLQSAATTQTKGALRNQNWNDHIQSTTDNQGHLSHIGERIRQDHSKWSSGAEGTCTIVSASSPDDVYVAVTSGKVYQMHKQTFPAADMQTGDDIHVVNHSTTPYTAVTNLNTQTLDANGNTLVNKYFSFVVWGVQNKTGEESHLMLNLPTDTYTSAQDAIDDASNYSVYDIPAIFQGVGFLIARFTFYYSSAGSGTWTLQDTEDLRGKIPNNVAGGGGGGGSGVSTFLALTDTPSSYSSQAGLSPVVNGGETALEFVDLVKSAGDTMTGALTIRVDNTGQASALFLANYTTATDFRATGIDFYLNNDSPTAFRYGRLITIASDVSAGTEDSIMVSSIRKAGAETEVLRLSSSEAVFNETGADIDFRAETDALTHGFFINAGTDVISMFGQSTFTGTGLDIWGGDKTLVLGGDNNAKTRTDATAKIAKIATVHYTNAEEPFCLFLGNGGSSNNIVGVGGGTSTLNAATIIRFYTASNSTTVTGTERMSINADGSVVINDGGNDSDFRVEGDTDTHLLFTDAGNDRVGIGESSPATILHIDGEITLNERSADPSDPAEGTCVLWMSDGTGTGDDGDILIKITAGGTTKTVAIIDFSEA